MTRSLEELIAAKVRAALGKDAELASLTALAGDASSRRYYRALLTGPKLPRSLVVMQLPGGSGLPLSSEELAIFKQPLNELPFLNVHRFLSKIGVRVPRLYGRWEKEGILLLEDLGDTALWDRVQGSGEPQVLHWYRKAIDELLVIQLRGTKAADETCIAFQQRFDARLYLWEFDHFIEYALVKRPGIQAREHDVDALRRIFAAMAHKLDRQSPCLNHRDYHSWNMMIHEDAIAVIDFQDALLAPPQYDLASLLNDRDTDRVISPPLEQQLMRYYLDRREEWGHPKVSRDEFLEIYLLSAIQRDLKVVGRFIYLDRVKGKSGYNKFIPPTLRRLKRNIARTPRLENLDTILADYYEEMR
ncbi:MAG TPA: phosphotransferase [Candidatus Binatia bacterium]|nr:phosphotransferase [Candidatus Binatia bacterium]